MELNQFTKDSMEMEEVLDKAEYTGVCSGNAQEILTKSISSKELAKIINTASATIAAACGDEYDVSGLILAHMNGSLTAYSHTLVLSVIGILIDHEIL